MGLSYCSSCGSVEGGFREPTVLELSEVGLGDDHDLELEDYVCEQCGEMGTYTGLPEHDDMDMER